MSSREGQPVELSVVIPTRNRAGRVVLLLDSIAKVLAPHITWEVIVVDNGSTDGTAAVVRRAVSTARVPLRYVLESEPGLHACRHRGAQEARGAILAYLDDDTQVQPEWLRGADPLFQGRADAVVCRILPQWEGQVPVWLGDLVSTGVYGPLTLLDLGNEPSEVEAGFVWGAGFFIRKSLVFDLAGFHPDSMPVDLLRFRGDGESGLMRKFAAAGHRAVYEPSSVVEHAVPQERMTKSYLRERYYRQGISDSFAELREEFFRSGDSRPAADMAQASMSRGGPIPAAGVVRATGRKAAVRLRRGRSWVAFNMTASRRSMHGFDSDMWGAHMQGRDFHRRAVEADAGVRDWLQQPHYIGVSLAEFFTTTSSGGLGGRREQA